MKTMKKIIDIINTFLIDEFELEQDQLQPQALLKEDLDIESLDFVDIAVILEKEFGFKVLNQEMVGIKTLQDLYNFVYAKLDKTT
jgi:acyl carrier protein